MFNFLNSAVLVAAAAALIPLLIHLFSKRRVRIVDFSSLKHLKEMQKRQVRRIKIRQLLLLLLRMLIILAAVLAFARPATRGGYVGSHAGVSSVVLLDRSASMQRQTRDGELFELARSRAGQLLKNFGQSDEVALIPFGERPEFPAGERFFSADVAGNVLDETTAGSETGNLGEAYTRAVEMLSGAKNLNKELYLLTDRQLNSLPDTPSTTSGGITYYLADLPVEIDGNCGIVGIDMGGQLIEVGSEFNVKAEIRNYDARDKSELLASMFIDGTRVMQSEFRVDGNERTTVGFRHAVSRTGFHSGWIEISDDDFLPDNRYYFTFRIPDQFNVLIVDGDGGGEIIKLALVPSEKLSRYWSVKSVRPDMLASIRLRDYDVVIVSGPKNMGAAETSRLLNFVDAGGGLFFIIGPLTDMEYYNRFWSGRTGVSLRAPVPDNFTGAGYYTLEQFDYGHIIFSPFAELFAEEIPTFKFYALPGLSDTRDNRDLAYFSNGAPAMAETGFWLGKIILFTSPFLPRYTDIASHSFFVPLVIRTIEYLSNDLSAYEADNFVGENLIRTVGGNETETESIRLVAPDDRNYQIVGTEQTGQMIYNCRPIDLPGIYRLYNGDKLVDQFPVNVPADEGDLSVVDAKRLMTSLGAGEFRTIPYDSNPERIVTEARFGRELWKVILWAAAVLMLVEMIFAREKGAVEEE
jgi:hypothetical protein